MFLLYIWILKDLYIVLLRKIAISIMLGLGLATLFKRVCKNRNCLSFPCSAIRSNKR